MLDTFKGIAQANRGSGETILFWHDKWNRSLLQHDYPHLYSFSKNSLVSAQSILHLESLEEHFHLPLFVEAYTQYCELDILLQPLQGNDDMDSWFTFGVMISILQQRHTDTF
jgi:hypothetical protein